MNIEARDGARLHVEVHGDGPCVLMLHSLGADHHVWDGVAKTLAEDYLVVAPDARGHGQSAQGGVSLNSQVQDVEDILRALQIPSAHVVGISMGGVEALAYYGIHPQRVLSLTLVDTFASLGEEGPTWVRDKEQQLQMEPMGQFARAYTENTLMPSTPPHVRGLLYEAVAGVTPEDYVAAARACFLANLEAVLPTVSVPALVLVGSHDRRTPLQFSQHLAEGISGAELDVVAEAGHLSAMDNPGFVAERLRRFLGREKG